MSKFVLDDVATVVEFVAEMYGMTPAGFISVRIFIIHLELKSEQYWVPSVKTEKVV
jgi:hypothetical protein